MSENRFEQAQTPVVQAPEVYAVVQLVVSESETVEPQLAATTTCGGCGRTLQNGRKCNNKKCPRN
jgi:bacterioferritin-associated ferredoxin